MHIMINSLLLDLIASRMPTVGNSEPKLCEMRDRNFLNLQARLIREIALVAQRRVHQRDTSVMRRAS